MPAPSVSSSVDRHLSVSSSEWEEPHPGQRLSGLVEPLSNDQDPDQDTQLLEVDTGSTVGTLYRATSHGLYLAPSDSAGQGDVQTLSTTVDTSKPMVFPDTDSAISGSLSESPSSGMTCQTLDVDIQMTDIDKSLDPDGPRSPSFLALSPISEYEDLSNYLGGSPTSERWSSVMDINDPVVYQHASPIEDMYGWDAEWDRRVIPPSSVVVGPGDDIGSRQSPLSRRASTSKGGLLQRVLSVGKAPSRISTSRRARFNPS